MDLKYIHLKGGEAKNAILKPKGIVTDEKQVINKLQPKYCPACNESNTPNSWVAITLSKSRYSWLVPTIVGVRSVRYIFRNIKSLIKRETQLSCYHSFSHLRCSHLRIYMLTL